jgi:hypothetical protein
MDGWEMLAIEFDAGDQAVMGEALAKLTAAVRKIPNVETMAPAPPIGVPYEMVERDGITVRVTGIYQAEAEPKRSLAAVLVRNGGHDEPVGRGR